MRVLLDECLPRRLKHALLGHDVKTSPECGWAAKRNGELLSLAERDFDVFVTADQNLSFQQSLRGRRIAIIVVRARSTRLEDLLPIVPALLDAWTTIQPGVLQRLGP